jgi:CubicO group peptidase (beta-lactamase class C family)
MTTLDHAAAAPAAPAAPAALSPRTRLAAGVTALLVALLAVLVMPRPWHPGGAQTGDGALAADLRAALGDDDTGYRGLAVARVTGAGTAVATVGDTGGGSRFEIGSVTKTFTGMLLADQIAAGTVRPADTLGAVWPDVRFSDPATATITLEELASHRSGLPRLGGISLLDTVPATLGGGDPYAGADVGALLAAAAQTRVGPGRGTVEYSNFGMALLGQALAARAGMPYPELVAARLLRPLGMARTGTAAGGDLAVGATAEGRPTAPWSGDGYAPAGVGVRSTAADLAAFVAGVLAGTAPGASATEPRFAAPDGDRVGYGWFTSTAGDRELLWHNGGTGGFSSYVGIDRAAGRGVVVLGNTDRGVERLGMALLGAPAPDTPADGWTGVLVTIVGLLIAAGTLPLLAGTPAGRHTVWRPAPDRLRVLSGVLSSAFLLAGLTRIGTWVTVPPALWVIGCGLAAGGLAALVLRWGQLPTIRDGRPWLRWASFGVSATVAAVVLIAVATVD